MFRRVAVTFILSFALAQHASGQTPSGGTAPSFNPEQIKKALLSGTDQEKAELARQLRLLMPARTIVAAKESIPCIAVDSVTIRNVVLLPPGRQVVLEVFSEPCKYVFLSILDADRGEWKFIRTVPLWLKERQPKITFPNLVERGVSEIMVEDNEVNYGTGIFQTNFTVFKLFPGGLEVVLDLPEHVTYAVPLSPSKPPYNSDQSQESQFTLTDSRGGPGLKEIHEKQTVRDHKIKIVRWWQYNWNPELRRFVASPSWH